MKKSSFFAISVLLHASLVAVLTLTTGTPQLQATPPIEIVVVPGEPSKPPSINRPLNGAAKSSVRPTSSAKNSAKKQAHIARRIFEQSGALWDENAPERAGTTAFDSDLADNQIFAEAEANVFGHNDNWAFHQQVFKNVDSHLLFDSMLARYNHFGIVYLEFSVDPKGYLLEKSLKASASDAILKVHAVRALRQALGEEFEPTKWSVLDKPVVFRAKFEFTKESGALNFKKQNAFSDPVFVFRRATNEGDVASFAAHNGSIGVNMDYEEILTRLQNRKRNRVLKAGDYDPFASYRSDPAYTL